MYKVLAVDDDLFFLELISSTLDEYEVITASDVNEARKQFSCNKFDLIMFDINLGDAEGFDLCKELRELDADVPVLFISALIDVDSRLKAYGVGGNDYIAKPYQRLELLKKVEQLITVYQSQQTLKQQIQDHTKLLTNIQKDSAYLQSVNRFMQMSMKCNDVDSLIKVFFITLKELDTSGILMTLGRDSVVESSNGHISHLEEDILQMCRHLPRIHSFGKGRGLFNWNSATLLVRDIHSLIDILAILMDSFDLALNSIDMKSDLARKISEIECSNIEGQHEIRRLMEDMTLALQESMVTLGLVSELGEEEEAHIHEIIKTYSAQMGEKMDLQVEHSLHIRELVDKMRAPSEEVLQLLANSNSPEKDDDFEMF